MSFSNPPLNSSESIDSIDFADSVESAPELLAPAGTLSSLLAAVQNGADAVYMGASRFSARAFAGNFSDYELAAGIDYAHAFGKKVYVTLNTLYRDDELNDVTALFDELYQLGVDSVIVQDLGLLALLSEKYPNFAFHASTQMTVHNSYHALFLKKRGIVRIVPARENSIPELKAIKTTGVEVETFIHGALCICYSGQCLFSSLVGSRSGNRGKCAQPCRKKYTLLAAGKPVSTVGQYLLSPKDLNSSENIEKLMDAGVDSFKIEGRMKKPEYVAGVVSVYRNIIDRILNKKNKAEHEKSDSASSAFPTLAEKEKLKKLFNRDFTSGYFIKNPENDLMSRKLPYNKGILIGKIIKVDSNKRQIHVLLTSELSAHDGISIGDLEKEMRSTKDPRQGFPIHKMYVGRSICSKAFSGDTVEIPLPSSSDYESMRLPNSSDLVYKTFDFELQKELSKTFPALDSFDDCEESGNENGEKSNTVSEAASIQKTLKETYNSINFSETASASFLSSDSFPIAEIVEMLSPQDSIKISVSFDCILEVGKPISIIATDENGQSVSVLSEYIIESAQKNPFSKNQASDLLLKLGNTIYQVDLINVSVIGDCFIPVGEFKNIRNKALQALLTTRIENCRRPKSETEYDSPISPQPFFLPTPLVSVSVYAESELKAALEAGADRIYIGGDIFKNPITEEEYGITVSDLENIVSNLSDSDKSKIFFKTPFVTKENDFDSLGNTFEILKQIGISGISASNIGVYEFLKSDESFSSWFRIAADSAFNVFNSVAANLIFEAGAESVILSQEMSITDISKLAQNLANSKETEIQPLECLVHGRQRLMVTEHPLLESLLKSAGTSFSSSSKSLSDSFFEFVLKDAKNYSFPILTDVKRRNYVYNSKELNAYGLLPKLRTAGISIFKIDGIGHSDSEIFTLVSQYKNGLALIDSGNFKSDVSMDGSDFTNGSFLRGVE